MPDDAHPSIPIQDSLLQAELERFLLQPWCRKLIQDPQYTVSIPACRRGRPDAGDSMFSVTLNTDSTVRSMVCLAKMPKDAGGLVEEAIFLIEVGSGINGFPGISHGGVVATLLDECIGSTLRMTHRVGVEPVLTKYLKVIYVKPLKTPGFLQCTTRLDKSKSLERKRFYSAELRDGEGTVMATGEALFLVVQRSKI